MVLITIVAVLLGPLFGNAVSLVGSLSMSLLVRCGNKIFAQFAAKIKSILHESVPLPPRVCDCVSEAFLTVMHVLNFPYCFPQAFILPTLFALKLMGGKMSRFEYAITVFLCFFGFCAMAVATAVNVIQIVDYFIHPDSGNQCAKK